jgi:hypothetical protein
MGSQKYDWKRELNIPPTHFMNICLGNVGLFQESNHEDHVNIAIGSTPLKSTIL